jgi:Zn-dependent M28 family amino/carboxypeptidase
VGPALDRNLRSECVSLPSYRAHPAPAIALRSRCTIVPAALGGISAIALADSVTEALAVSPINDDLEPYASNASDIFTQGAVLAAPWIASACLA